MKKNCHQLPDAGQHLNYTRRSGWRYKSCLRAGPAAQSSGRIPMQLEKIYLSPGLRETALAGGEVGRPETLEKQFKAPITGEKR
jgi:hypothetical protein